MTKRLTKLYLYIFTILITTSCSIGKYVPEGKYYLKKNQITCTDKKVGKTYIFEDYIKQGLIDLRTLISKTYGKEAFPRTVKEINKSPAS